mgnify:FL=1|tara:strand:- start:5059 stop:5877 length:819 start_codon:yes stop_codon:yes gene_type:complete
MYEGSVGIIGNGFVGNAIYTNLKNKTDCKVYDIDASKSVDSLDNVLGQDFIFVCLPSPMKPTGECDLSIIYDFFNRIMNENEPIYILKSTVPIGTTQNLRGSFKIIHNPEFLTARNSAYDYAHADRNIIGGDKDLCNQFLYHFNKWFPEIPNLIVSSDESEAIKYFANVFLAHKVAFFNKVYDMCQKTGMMYENVRLGVASDGRIGNSHTKVPGFDNDRGFGGSCFPKDLSSLINQFETLDIDAEIFRSVWKYNKQIRTVIDWTVSKNNKVS